MECGWSTLSECSPVDWAQIAGALGTMFAAVAAVAALVTALVQLREQRRQQAIQLFVSSFDELSNHSSDLTTVLESWPIPIAEIANISRKVATLAFLMNVVQRSTKDAGDYISDADVNRAAHQVTSVVDALCNIMNPQWESTSPLVEPELFAPSFRVTATNWSLVLCTGFVKLRRSAIAERAIGLLIQGVEGLRVNRTPSKP